MILDVRQNIKDTLYSRFNDYLEVPDDKMVRDKMTDNRGNRAKSASKREDSALNSKRCDFCGQNDPNFANEKKYDMHLWKECPMLVLCKSCGSVIQISAYTDHLLSSCTGSRHKQCARCKEAISREEYDNHVQMMTCPPARKPEDANRCPLCSADIPPGNQGWVEHVMTDGCPNNERTLAP